MNNNMAIVPHTYIDEFDCGVMSFDVDGNPIIEHCNVCDNVAIDVCDVCGATVCNDHVNITQLQFGRIWVRCYKCVRMGHTMHVDHLPMNTHETHGGNDENEFV